MPEDDAGAAADPALVAVTEVGEKAAGAVAVESKQEFAPELLAWLKRFKLESPDMLETLKKLNAYKPTDLIKCTEADIVSLKLKPAVQARFREGVSALQAEQKPRTPTKEEREKQRAAAAAALDAKRAEERTATIRAQKEKADRADQEKKDREAAAKSKAAADARTKEEAAETERKKRFLETQNAFGPVTLKGSSGSGSNSKRGGGGTTPPGTPPPGADGAGTGSEPDPSSSPPIVLGAALDGSETPFVERETVAQESPEFSFHRDIISEAELREDLMRRKRFHDAQTAAMEARSSLTADKVADLGAKGPAAAGAAAAAVAGGAGEKGETEEERERRLRFQDAQKLAAAKPRKSEENPGPVKMSEDEEERKKRFEENKKKALEAKSGGDKSKDPIQLSEEEEERRRRFEENKKKAAEAAAEVERLKREDDDWQRSKGKKSGAGGSERIDAGGKGGSAGSDDEGTGGMCGCFGGKKKK